MFSRIKKKDKGNELRRVNSNESSKSSKPSMFRLFSFHNEDKSFVNEVDTKNDLITQYLTSNGLPPPKVLLNDEIKLSICNDNIFLPTLIRDDEDELSIDDISEITEDETHTFAVVLNIPKPTKLSLEMKLKCICKNYWPNSIPDSSQIRNEVFKLGELSFNLSLENYNSFVPLSGNISINDQVTQPTVYRQFDCETVIDSGYYKDVKNDVNDVNQIIFPPGDYIYLVPICFPLNIPESIITEYASINYSFDFNINLGEDKAHYLEHFVNLIRSPPKLDISTYNKPIYINKVWDDAINYEVTFPKKFVTIGEELQIKLSFVPLVKKVNLNKIKINILQKISYINKDLNHERSEIDEKKYKNGHAINLLELRPDDAKFTSFSAREDTINRCCLQNRNFLTCSYVNGDDPTVDEVIDWDQEELIGPLTIKSYIPLVKPAKSLKFYRDNQFFNENLDLKDLLIHKNRALIQAKPRHQGSMNEIPLTTKINPQFIDGLLPSASTNYIRIQHKLQICLRITRKTDRVHNYEVLIDTPIFLLNSACTSENIELPPYIDTNLPSFEEATSPVNSPIISPYEETFLSRTNTVISNNTYASDELVDQIDELVLNRSTRNSMDMRRGSTGSAIVNNLMRTMSKDPPNYEQALEEDLNESTDLTDQYRRLR